MPTKVPLSRHGGALGTSTFGTGWRPPTHWLNAVSRPLPKMEISAGHSAFTDSLTIPFSMCTCMCAKGMGTLKAGFTSQPQKGSHIIEKNWFSKTKASADCLLMAHCVPWWCVCFFPTHDRTKRSCKKKKKDGNRESLKLPWNIFSLGTTVLAVSFDFLQNDLTFRVGGYSLEPLQTVFCYYFNSQ